MDLTVCTIDVKRLNSIICSVSTEPSVCGVEPVRALLMNEVDCP